MCFGYIFYILSFLELMPQFSCTLADDTFIDSCSNDQICQGTTSPQIPYNVEYNNNTSLYNWVE